MIHLNWRTINFPADQMLDAGYPVVNAAWDPLYIVDHYPRNNFTMASPEYIYKKLDLHRFKHFNPAMRTFREPVTVNPNDRLISFCMPWWEGCEENFFAMIVPRLIPMAEVAWDHQRRRDYRDFNRRAIAAEVIRQKCFYPVSISASPMALEREGVFHEHTTVGMTSGIDGDIRYSLDGSQPTEESLCFGEPFLLDKSAWCELPYFTTTSKSAMEADKRSCMCRT